MTKRKGNITAITAQSKRRASKDDIQTKIVGPFLVVTTPDMGNNAYLIPKDIEAKMAAQPHVTVTRVESEAIRRAVETEAVRTVLHASLR